MNETSKYQEDLIQAAKEMATQRYKWTIVKDSYFPRIKEQHRKWVESHRLWIYWF